MAQIDTSFLIKIAKEAGAKIMGIYAQDFSVEYKEDESPLTQADIVANDHIVAELKKAYPTIPIMTEESKQAPYDERKSWSEFFCVDPIDGTKEFVKKNGEFTVNIAYIKDGIPTIGVIYAPVLEETYYSDGEKSYKQTLDETHKLPLQRPPIDTVVASRSHLNEATKELIDEKGFTNIISRGSSLKFCLLAEGKAMAYIRDAPTMEWDTAAGEAIVRTVGKTIVSLDSNRTWEYNKENLRNPGFIVE